jgi:hypothetical protein
MLDKKPLEFKQIGRFLNSSSINSKQRDVKDRLLLLFSISVLQYLSCEDE